MKYGTLKELQLNKMIEPFIHPSAEIREGCEIGEGTVIGPFVRLEANVKIGKWCTIGPFSVIAEDTIIADDVFIGPFFGTTNDKKPHIGPHGLHPDKPKFDAMPPRIYRGAVIGERVTLAPGVTIGEGARIDMCAQIYSSVLAGKHIRAGVQHKV